MKRNTDEFRRSSINSSLQPRHIQTPPLDADPALPLTIGKPFMPAMSLRASDAGCLHLPSVEAAAIVLAHSTSSDQQLRLGQTHAASHLLLTHKTSQGTLKVGRTPATTGPLEDSTHEIFDKYHPTFGDENLTNPSGFRLTTDIMGVLHGAGLHNDAFRLRDCKRYQRCNNLYCIHCRRIQAVHQRLHARKSITQLLALYPKAQLFHLSATTEDSHDVRASGLAAVNGMKKLLKHPRLVRRVLGSFSVLEYKTARGRSAPCAHVHTIIVVKQITDGRYRISPKDWISIWEVACPLARKSQPKLKPKHVRRKGVDGNPNQNVSLLAKRIPLTAEDIAIKTGYLTKWANYKNICADYRALLKVPGAFIERINTLKGVTRYFGDLHLRPKGPEVSVPKNPKRRPAQATTLPANATRDREHAGTHSDAVPNSPCGTRRKRTSSRTDRVKHKPSSGSSTKQRRVRTPARIDSSDEVIVRYQ